MRAGVVNKSGGCSESHAHMFDTIISSLLQTSLAMPMTNSSGQNVPWAALDRTHVGSKHW